ncbi:hypothetical protein CPAST_c37770 [Clostridium pasteurianum DSM 525 = ATCC 6013]|uniref:Lipoprotein n=1 Tax=Clostridium pasteurianum DSM 525 = ATCC 6013 TaxID=1262449 RepID=A0A0H3JBJ0_CLOPA|nr:hypothetical protein CPAST_c37770 [Clostridium pasteurianum DSM 525 = ATCC 6013]AJA53803.1 hypothetical protein CLPA_c37770 [Clostridium pasteurianum DSM 525 = ATCC 6013]KRU14172.1 hypothetical protein CP6013_03428 [Clostridium pasteurianum DSM 525 = ATCC 6013]
MNKIFQSIGTSIVILLIFVGCTTFQKESEKKMICKLMYILFHHLKMYI